MALPKITQPEFEITLPVLQKKVKFRPFLVKEEKVLLEKSEEYKTKIEERLAKAYTKIRTNVKNGLAVVPIERGASGGSYFTIPPQVQVEIASRKKIITDEHSGRILVDAELAEEQKVKMEKLFSTM